ncbi:MAG: TPM domain-containing protein [Desulfuromonadales bacterium]
MNITSLLLVVLLLICPASLLALDAPRLSGRVNDLAQVMSPESRQQLEQRLSEFERDTSNQVVVLTIPSLQGDNIEQFSIRVAETWKIGQKGRDNGILLIVAQSERKVRIEVGMGLQGILPDLAAGQIIRDIMRPHLKNDNYDQGISAGVDSIIAATKGEFNAAGQSARQPTADKKKTPTFLTMLLVTVFVAIVLGFFSRYLGGIAGAVGLPLLSYAAFPGLGIITLILLAVFGLFAGLLLSMALSSMFGGGYGGGSGGFGSGFGGGFFGGGGSSSGGDSFSGGGGDFDGGGSSDDF